ncbi:MAG: spermidine/putrescine ABC transporter permease PotB [Desulfomicrobium sp.]|nr:spermidine/putrescine ABC transporter permease PotB [Pseudomonadota bacterium]MBV1710553.1 spermidine/putrescine ABC transporter permease PotB [Desulfomicrobium sp.]MBU4570161.1 spermidine/putrescine ABC transporter permease PotB [Pseudomonadota bacterium]MBU4593081.1 spermidine/putrescine ABC transporter permease PotB [Pseudomonadota bacterium]MBV1718890.1 spermidine/putrescine ABC transporter permease PotB [Desulfomicrobium sp.]
MKNDGFFKLAVIVGVISWMAIFAFVPNILVFLASFSSTSTQNFIEPGFSLSNYARLMDTTHLSILLSSLRLSGLVTVICLVTAYPFAAILARTRKPLRNTLLLLVVIPFWTNSLVRTYAMTAMINSSGIVNNVLLSLGIIDTPLAMMYTPGAVVLGLVYTLLPFMILPLYAALERLDRRYLEAARDLGASPWRAFWKVVVPLTMPGIVSGCMLVFLPGIGMFYVSDVLGGAKAMLLGNFIRDQFLTTRDWPLGAAASVTLTVLMGVMLLLYWKSAARLGGKEA